MSSELAQLWEGAGGQVPPNADVVPFESLLAGPKAIAVGVMYPGEHCDDGVPLIKVGDINGGRIPAEPKFKVSQAVNTEYQRTQLRGDELLITLVGEPGACVVATSAMKGWNPARAIAVARLKDPSLRTYVKAVLESRPGKHLIDSVLNTTVQKTLNLKDIRQLPVPLPARSVVDAVSHVVDALDDRITLLRETNATLEAIAQALFKSWFVDFDPVRAKMAGRAPEGMDEATAALFPHALEETELGLVPKGWRIGCIEELCSMITNGGTPSRSKPKFWDGGSIPWFKTGEFQDGFLLTPSERITDDALSGSSVKLLPKNAILMAIYAAPTVGRLGILTEPATFNQACTGMVAKAEVGPWFLFWTLFNGRDWFNSRANGAAQQNISKAIVAAYRMVVPSPPVFDAFNDAASTLHDAIRSNAEKSQTLSELRDTLLPRLISGQIRLPEAQAQLEEALA